MFVFSPSTCVCSPPLCPPPLLCARSALDGRRTDGQDRVRIWTRADGGQILNLYDSTAIDLGYSFDCASLPYLPLHASLHISVMSLTVLGGLAPCRTCASTGGMECDSGYVSSLLPIRYYNSVPAPTTDVSTYLFAFWMGHDATSASSSHALVLIDSVGGYNLTNLQADTLNTDRYDATELSVPYTYVNASSLPPLCRNAFFTYGPASNSILFPFDSNGQKLGRRTRCTTGGSMSA